MEGVSRLGHLSQAIQQSRLYSDRMFSHEEKSDSHGKFIMTSTRRSCVHSSLRPTMSGDEYFNCDFSGDSNLLSHTLVRLASMEESSFRLAVVTNRRSCILLTRLGSALKTALTSQATRPLCATEHGRISTQQRPNMQLAFKSF